MNAALDQLCRGESLSGQQTEEFFANVVTGDCEPLELAAMLVALRCKGETAEEVYGAASALLAAAEPFATPDYDLIDCCGTGGDGLATLNVSTATAFVLAALGVPVAKHGNRAVSSKSGSTDVLKILGIPFDATPTRSRQLLDDLQLAFLHAPQYHAGVKHAMPVRQTLKVRTLFNLLGPIINPARPNLRLIGLYDARYLTLVAETLQKLGVSRALVVNGEVDEIAVHGETQIVELRDGKLQSFTITPEQLGLPRYPVSAIAGGEPEYNAEALLQALAGKGSEAYRTAIAANAGAGLYLAGKADSLKHGAEFAMAALQDGVVETYLQRYMNEVRDAA